MIPQQIGGYTAPRPGEVDHPTGAEVRLERYRARGYAVGIVVQWRVSMRAGVRRHAESRDVDRTVRIEMPRAFFAVGCVTRPDGDAGCQRRADVPQLFHTGACGARERLRASARIRSGRALHLRRVLAAGCESVALGAQVHDLLHLEVLLGQQVPEAPPSRIVEKLEEVKVI